MYTLINSQKKNNTIQIETCLRLKYVNFPVESNMKKPKFKVGNQKNFKV